MAIVSVAEMQARLGTEAVSDWLTVDQAMIDAFAEATGDRQFIHVDPVAAAATPFGGTIAHGFLTLSLMPRLAAATPDLPRIDGAAMSINYGSDKVRFLSPVRSGARVRGRFATLAFREKKPRHFHHLIGFTVEIEGQDTPALVAEWITLIVV